MLRIAASPFTELGTEEEFFQRIREDRQFIKALKHANPFVHERAVEWFSGELTDKKKVSKIRHTLYNYYTRWYLTTTPYGFFSSVGVLGWSEEGTDVQLESFRQSYRIDMDVLSKLADLIFSQAVIRDELLYFPNNTIYVSGDYLRFLEAFDDGGKIGYKISAVEQSDVLSAMIGQAQDGITISGLADRFVNEEYGREDLVPFINELIDAQLLLPEINLNISGPDVFMRLYELISSLPLKGQPEYDRIMHLLGRLQAILTAFTGGDFFTLNENLKKTIESAGILPNDKFLLQVDNFSVLKENLLDEALTQSLYEATSALSCFNQNDYKPFLETFKKKFTERYEGNSVPLLQAIDTESGISFGDIAFQNDSVLLKDVTFEPAAGAYITHTPKGDELRSLLYKKYYEALKTGADAIIFKKEDLVGKAPKLPRLAPNFQIIFSVVDRGKGLLHLRTVGNSSGGNLLSRFCYASPELTAMLQKIGEWEGSHFKDFVVAEILHISSFRTGNITFRPSFRKYEIPVFMQSTLPPAQQILLSDLMVCVREGKIVLWSKRLQKRVIPMLTNAHNHNLNTTPIYQFLAEVSYQDTLPSLFMDRAETTLIGNYVPRIQYENVILYPATWRFDQSELKELADRSDTLSIGDLSTFRQKWELPEKMSYVDGGSNILVDWTSPFSVHYFLRSVATRKDFIFLEEFLFTPEGALVKDSSGRSYVSECIAVVNNTIKPTDTISFNHNGVTSATHKFHPGEEWVYYKIYCGVVTGDKLLANEISGAVHALFEQGLISKFFFIRYNDPDYHIRVRFRTDPDQVHEVMKLFSDSLAAPLSHDLISRLQLDTYVRELERYGHDTIDFAEAVFQVDSLFVLAIIPLIRESYAELSPFIFMKGVDTMLDAFGFGREEKRDFLKDRKLAYESEFRLEKNVNLKQVIFKKELHYRAMIQKLLHEDLSVLSGVDEEQLQAAIQSYRSGLAEVYAGNVHLIGSREQLHSLLASFTHMHAIRMFQTKPRENEFIAYELLHAAYSATVKNEARKYDKAPGNS